MKRSGTWMAVVASVFISAACGGGDGTAGPPASPPVPVTVSENTVDPLEGSWTTGETTCAQQETALERAGFTPKEIRQDVDFLCQVDSFEIRFLHGQLVILEDGAVGWSGSYALVDDRTFTAGDIETGFDYITYRYQTDGNQLTVDMVEDDCPPALCKTEAELTGETGAQTIVYESAPFERID